MISRQYMIFNISEIDTIDFSQVCETSVETIRKSPDGSKTFVKWDSAEIPACVEALTTKEGPYNHKEILEILSTDEWSPTLIQSQDTQVIEIGESTQTTTESIPIGATSSPSASGVPV
jgi:hypothetical protein